eukprot:15479163-Alexandrium_andersonii.AAC.2
MAAHHHVDALHEARGMARTRQAAKACDLPPDGDRQVVEVHVGRQAHAKLAGGGRGIRGIALTPPAMGTMDDS